MLKKLSRYYKIIILLFLSIHIILIGFFNYSYSHNIIQKNYVLLNSKNIIQKGESIHKFMQLIETAFSKISNDSQLKRELSTEKLSFTLKNLLKSYVLTIPGISRIHLYTDSGMYYSTDARYPYYKAQTVLDTSQYASSDGWSIAPTILEENTNNHILHYFTEVTSDTHKIHYLIMEIDNVFLSNTIHSSTSPAEEIILKNNSSSIVLYGESYLDSFNPNATKDDFINIYENNQMLAYKLKDNFIFIYSFNDYPLQLISTVPNTQIKIKLDDLKNSILLSSFILIIISVFISIFISNIIWNPLKKILYRFNNKFHVNK